MTFAAGTCGAGRDIETRTPLLPLSLDGARLPLRAAPPVLGEHTDDLLVELGYSAAEIYALHEDAVVGAASRQAQGPGVEPADA